MFLFNNYSPKALWILSNNPLSEVEELTYHYSVSRRRIIVLAFRAEQRRIKDWNKKIETQLFVCIHECSRIFLIISLHIQIDSESVYSSSSAVKQTSEALRKINSSSTFCFIVVDFVPSCHDRLKMSSFSLEKNRFRSIDLAVLPINVTTAFTSVNHLEYEFLKGFMVQGHQQSFWTFSIQQLSTIFTCRDGEGDELSTRV